MRSVFSKLLCTLLVACLLLQSGAAASELLMEEHTAGDVIDPSEEATDPTEEVTDPSEEVTDPTEEVTDPTEEVTDPTEEVTDPSEEATDPTEEATEPTEEVTEPTEPDPLEGYVFPDTWAKEALRFAVRHGILKGRANKNLDPTGLTTRAEMATMLVRLIDATGKADLSAYRDVAEGDWYYEVISAAVEQGLLKGVSATAMAPNRKITRQETFVLLARAFGLYPQNTETYKRFSDAGQIDTYAREAVSVLAELGCIEGYGDNTLRPLKTITRQETAALFYKLLDVICSDPAQIPASGVVLYRGNAPIPADLTLDGTLILAGNGREAMTLQGLSVSGGVTLRRPAGVVTSLKNVTAGSLCIPTRQDVTGEDCDIGTLFWNGSGGSADLTAKKLCVYAPGTFYEACEQVAVYSDGGVFRGVIQNLDVFAKGTVTVHEYVNHAVLQADSVNLTGTGYVETVTIRGKNCTVSVSRGKVVDEIFWGLAGVTGSITGTTVIAGTSNPSATLTVTFKNFRGGYGTVNGALPCQLYWYENGKLVAQNQNFLLKEGATATLTRSYNADTLPSDKVDYAAVLVCGNDQVRATHTASVDFYSLAYINALRTVQTVNVSAVTNRETKLYSSDACTRVLRTLPKGTTVTHLYHSSVETKPGKVRLSDGTVGWLNWSHYNVSRENYVRQDDYSVGTKEGFVNQKGYSSSSGYLVWLSLKTQRVNVYTGSKGNWKLTKSFLCSSGKNTTPTVSGVYSIIYKTDRWRFDETIDDVFHSNYFYVKSVTGFWGGQAFHSILYRTKDDGVYDGRLGTPLSHGCVRLEESAARYINGLPYYTTVVIY